MKGIKNTFRLSKIAIKIAPFYLFYGISNCILAVFRILIPIGIVDLIVGYYYDGKEYQNVIIACIIIAVVYYLINVIYFIFQRFYNHYFRIFAAKFEISIYNKVKEIDYEVSQSSSFLNDYSRAIDEGAYACINSFWAVADVVSSIISAATIFTIFAILDVRIIIYAVTIGIIFFFLGKYNAKLYWKLSEIQKQNYRERGYIKRMFYLKDSAEDIRTTKIKDVLIDVNDQVGDRVIKNTDIYSSKRATISFISEILVKTIYPFALGFLAYITIGNKDINSFTALTVAAYSLSNIVSSLSYSLSRLQDQSTLGEAIFKVLDIKGNIEISGKKAVTAFEKLIVDKLNFSYKDKNVLNDVSLQIKKGEKIAIVGENGAGKTTFVKLLLRLYDPIEGSIIYNDDCYSDLYPKSIREHIGAVFQDFEVYALNVAENILLREIKTSEDEEIVIDALKFSGLYEKVIKLEKGIYTQVTKEFDKSGLELSKGERQKLVISRIYALNYDLIILDEPSSALDPIAEAEIYEKMMKLGNNRTLIFISHRLSTTINADQIYLFSDGKIVERGTHQQLMAIENGKYQYMFNIQAQNYIKGVNYENN